MIARDRATPDPADEPARLWKRARDVPQATSLRPRSALHRNHDDIEPLLAGRLRRLRICTERTGLSARLLTHLVPQGELQTHPPEARRSEEEAQPAGSRPAWPRAGAAAPAERLGASPASWAWAQALEHAAGLPEAARRASAAARRRERAQAAAGAAERRGRRPAEEPAESMAAQAERAGVLSLQ